MSESEESTRLLEEMRELAPLQERFVVPIYLRLLHANFVRRDESALVRVHDPVAVRELIRTAARTISDGELRQLLRSREWRGLLTAGWLIGISKRLSFIEEMGRLLLASEMTYSGQGYCVALGLIGDEACRKHLENYLVEYLPFSSRFYDQLWAIGALAHISESAAEPFLNPELWIAGGGRNMNPDNGIRNFKLVVDYLVANGMIGT